LWQILQSRRFEKKLRKEDPEVARRILRDLAVLKEAPLQGDAVMDERARKINLRYIDAAGVYRVFYRIEDKRVLLEFYHKRETCYEEIRRFLESLRL